MPGGGGPGVNSITIGKTPDIRTLSDNWYIANYKGYSACFNDTTSSAWAGDPTGTQDEPKAKLAEGWIKRVVAGLNPFDQAISDFHKAAPNTFASMLIQLGTRYEGDIALSPDPASLQGVRLIARLTRDSAASGAGAVHRCRVPVPAGEQGAALSGEPASRTSTRC